MSWMREHKFDPKGVPLTGKYNPRKKMSQLKAESKLRRKKELLKIPKNRKKIEEMTPMTDYDRLRRDIVGEAKNIGLLPPKYSKETPQEVIKSMQSKYDRMQMVRHQQGQIKISEIKNKFRRRKMFAERQKQMNRVKWSARSKRRVLRKKYGYQAAPFRSLKQEDKSKPDPTKVLPNDVEVEGDHAMDEFSKHFSNQVQPKICITTNRGKVLHWTKRFIDELLDVFPDAKYVGRGSVPTIKLMVKKAIKQKYTALIVLHNDRNSKTRPSQRQYARNCHKLLHVALPNGPTAFYRLSSFKPRTQIYMGAVSTAHRPELILSNFSSRLGVRMGRMLATMFDQRAEFRGRQVVTFRNQRDFIFFRRHRYMFTEEGQECELQELGPRFCLKLIYLHEGLFNPREANYEWKWTEDMGLEKCKFWN